MAFVKTSQGQLILPTILDENADILILSLPVTL